MKFTEYYELVMTTGTGKIDKQFKTYNEAYDYMCENYVREKRQGYTPTKFRIERHSTTEFNGAKNTMVMPTWG